jgi:hypothetical protein
MTIEKLIAALEKISFDGSECHSVVNAELRDPELELAASAIRHKIVTQYRGCAPIDGIVEIVGRLLEDGERG